MDKIKNLLNPGRAQDDETLYGTGQNTGTNTGNTEGLSGEGSHFGNTRDTTTGNTGGLTGGQTSGVTNTGAGVGNTQNTGLSGTNTTAGPHSSNLANKADPRVDSDLDGSRTVGNSGVTGSNTAGNTSSGHHLGRDAAAVGGAGAVGEGIHHHRENERDNLGSNTGYSGTNTTGAYHGGPTGSGVSGPHSSDTANRLDPSVNTRGTGGLEDAHHHSATHGGGAESADKHHHLGRDAAVGAGGVGLAEHEHHKHQNEREGYQLGMGDNSGTGSSGHHLGRDAAVGAGGAGLVDHHEHERQRGTGTGAYDNTTGSSGHHLGRDTAVGAGGVGLAEHEHHKHQGERGTGTGGYDNTTGSSGHHLGRDAAVGAGGVGLAEHEHHKHEQSATGTSNLPGPAPNTAGPHKQDWLNKLDPRVNADPNGPQTSGHGPFKVDSRTAATGKPYDPTSGYTANPAHHGIQTVPDGSHGGSSHLGRDAAGAGVVGAGAYEADKHHHNTRDENLGQTGSSGITGQSTAGPHSSNIANRADPTVDSDRSKDHHYGRDTAIAGGVGGAAYEADKHHKHDKDLTASEREQKREQKHELKEEKREHKQEKSGGLLSFLHRDKNKTYTPEEEAEFDRQEREHHSHKGRDALGGAAVGGGAYEAEKHHRDHHNTSGLDDDANVNKPLPTAPGNHGIGTGAGTHNALEDDTTGGRSGHHLGRDAAVGAGGVGLAEHEHRKHEGTGSGIGSTGQYDNTSSTGTGQHHLGRDAALAGGAGAVGVHEHDKHQGGVGATPLVEKPRGTDLGDKLHGVERNRGVQGPTGFPGNEGYTSGTTGTGTTGTGQHHLGRDAAVGAGGVGLAEHEHRKHEGTGSGLGTTGQYDTTTGTGQQHHLGRDAAVGAGGVGVAEHEHRKHEGLTGSNQGYDNTASSGLTGSNQGQHHYGRDAAGLGAAGAVGEHEYRKHDTTSGQHSGLTGGSGMGMGNTASVTGPNQPMVGDDRNRLHKDPPADHPAAQTQQGMGMGMGGGAHVPGSGGERERLVGQGEQSLDGQTGVENSHAAGGVNAASNY